jgi:hypothetical protein
MMNSTQAKEKDMEHGNENETMMNRIRALLAKAESTNFPEEAEAYTAKAMELMSKYGIDQTLLQAKENKTTVGDRIFKVYAPFARDKVTFFNAIVNALGGRAVWRIRGKRQANPGFEELHVFATETDLERIDMLFTSLLVQCANAMNVAVRETISGQNRPRKFKADFLYGFSSEVGVRLLAAERQAARDAEESAEAQGMSMALVLVSKKDQVNRRVENVYSHLTNNSRRRSELGAGYSHGTAAGRRADLGGVRMNTGAKQEALVG